MQLTACSLLYCCLLFAAMLFAVGTPGAPFYHPIGVLPQICGPPVASQPAAICSVYCHMLYMQPLCSQMQPTGSQMHPRRCPISARMLPCGQPNSTICNVFCNMLHMPPLCSQMQPTGSQIHPPGAKYQPLGSPVANQPAATQTPNSTRNAVMLQCSYGRKIMGAGGRGVSLQIRRAVRLRTATPACGDPACPKASPLFTNTCTPSLLVHCFLC